MVVCIPKRSDLFYIYRDFDDATKDWVAFSIDAISSDKKAMKIFSFSSFLNLLNIFFYILYVILYILSLISNIFKIYFYNFKKKMVF